MRRAAMRRGIAEIESRAVRPTPRSTSQLRSRRQRAHPLSRLRFPFPQALALVPEFPQAHAQLGLAYARGGGPAQKAKAVPEAAKAIELAPSNLRFRMNLARVLHALGNADALKGFLQDLDSMASSSGERAALQRLKADLETPAPAAAR